MPLVKRSQTGDFVESYEINSFTVNLDYKNISVQMTKYSTSTSGVPVASDFVYTIQDRVEQEQKQETVTKEIVQRDSSGAAILDDKGNPVMTTIEHTVQTTFDVEIKEFTELVTTATSGKTFYNEIQEALYKSFIAHYLNGETGFLIE